MSSAFKSLRTCDHIFAKIERGERSFPHITFFSRANMACPIRYAIASVAALVAVLVWLFTDGRAKQEDDEVRKMLVLNACPFVFAFFGTCLRRRFISD